MFCQSLNRAITNGKLEGGGNSKNVTTRFGNVLGINGSIIPIYRQQIENDYPISRTHPDIICYFMLIPETGRLVLQVGSMGNAEKSLYLT